MSALISLRTWLLSSLIWAAGVATYAWNQWPGMPLDVSAGDPATMAAYHGALWAHIVWYALIAVVPPFVALGAGKLVCRVACKTT